MQQLVIPQSAPSECHYANEGEESIGVSWEVRCGFHSIPSMRHVHLHVRNKLMQVISSELVSERLKNKKVRGLLI